METRKHADEAQIRQLVDGWARALSAKDVDGVMSVYAADVVWFDLAPPCGIWEQMHTGKTGKNGL